MALRVVVNGDNTDVGDGLTVTGLITSLELTPERVAVELNGRIIKRADWDRLALSEGDKIEVVHFVGGGCSIAPPEMIE